MGTLVRNATVALAFIWTFHASVGVAAEPENNQPPAQGLEVFVNALAEKAALYEKAGQRAEVCAMAGRALFFKSDHAAAAKLRLDNVAAGNAPGKPQKIGPADLKKADTNIQQALSNSIATFVEEAVNAKRFSDAGYWIRLTAEAHAKGAGDTKQAETVHKSLRGHIAKLVEGHALWPARSALISLAAMEVSAAEKKEREKALSDVNAQLKTDIEERDTTIATIMGGVSPPPEKSKNKGGKNKSGNDKPEKKPGKGYCELKASAHEMRYFLSLPEGFDAANAARYPVIVSVNGSGADYELEIKSWAGPHRGRGYIFVAPVTTSNTDKQQYPDAAGSSSGPKALAFDVAGVQAVLDDIEDRFLGDRERFFVSGFSGGGNFTYYSALWNHQRWRAAVPRNPNYFGDAKYGDPYGLSKKAVPETDIHFPVYIFTSGDDEHKESTFGKTPGIESQTQEALRDFKKFRYVCVQRTEIPGLKHGQTHKYYDKILEWLDAVQKGTHFSRSQK